jgi:formylmethanofuran dehydrogenase subunit C
MAGLNLCRNPDCPSDPDCICDGTGTPPPSGGQCDDIKLYKGETMVTDLSTLAAGDVISIYVRGTGATKGRVRINGGAFTETTLDMTSGTETWYVAPNITLPSGVTSITIESEVYVNGEWK